MQKLLTERMRLREPDARDEAFLVELMNEEGYLTQIGDRGIGSVEAAANYLRTSPIYQIDDGLGFNIIELLATGEPIGICGLVKRPEYRAPDIGYALLSRHSGRGLATEAAARVAAHAFDMLGLPELLGMTAATNTASRRVLEKLGMRLEEIRKDGECIYRLERNKWHS